MKDGRFLTLGIESSCDETAAAVLADGRTVLTTCHRLRHEQTHTCPYTQIESKNEPA